MIELLAPSKNLMIAKTAIDYGADAVYIGGKQFSLRSRASNFSLEDIKEIALYAHERRKRIYVTVNIVFHQEDLKGIEDYLITLETIGVDAVIIESLAVLQIGKRVAPKLEYHISTQLSSLNSLAVKALQDFGADRIVLARETSIEEVETISALSTAPLEVFLHGGMCANLSGRCVLSNDMTLRDANRGGCAQSCRWLYHLYNDENLLSDKDSMFSMGSTDLMALPYLERLVKAGVASLKVEGRMKSEYYIASVIRAYRFCIDEIERDGTLSKKRLNWALKELEKAENRKTAEGFYGGKIDSHIQLYREGDGARHDYIAYVHEGNENDALALIESKNPFYLHDEIEVISPSVENRRFILEELYEDAVLIEECKRPTTKLQIKCPFRLKRGDMLRRVRDDY